MTRVRDTNLPTTMDTKDSSDDTMSINIHMQDLSVSESMSR